MKKILIPTVAFLTLACVFGPFVAAPTQTPAPTPTETPSPTLTYTPITPTLTFTLTPTLIGIKTPTLTPEITDTPEVTATLFTPTLATLPNTVVPPVPMEGFHLVTVSLPEIFKAKKGCEPSVVRITAQVSDALRVKYVLLFVRFKSLKAEREGKWTSLPMTLLNPGVYIFDLSTDQMRDDSYFENAWIEYQIVSTTQSGVEIGRTDIFKERLKMLQCVPTPTPTSPNVKP